MNPKIWGPPGWIFLHSIAYGYPNDPTPDEKKAAINFFNSLGHMLPCKTCSELYKKDLVLFKKTNELKKAVENKTNLIKFINLIHNNVSKSLNKKQYSDVEYDNYYKNLPAINSWDDDPGRISSGKKVPDNFSYSSDNNSEWMTIEELQHWAHQNKDLIGKI